MKAWLNRKLTYKMVVCVLAVLFLVAVRAILVPFIFAGIIAYILEPPVRFLEKKGLNRTWAILLLYMFLLALASLSIYFIIPGLIGELYGLAQAIPKFVEDARRLSTRFQENYRGVGLPDGISAVLDDTIRGFEQRALTTIKTILEETMRISSGIIGILISPVLAFYILRDLEKFKRTLITVLPDRHFGSWLDLVRNLDKVVGGFVRAQLIVGAFVAVTVMLTMSFFKIRFAIILGIIAGLGEFIPYFGPVLASVPAVLFALARSPFTAMQTALVFVVIQQIDSTVIGPKILGDNVGLHPLMIIFSVLAGGYLFGVWGMFLAVPIAGIAKEVCRFIYRRCSEES